MKVDQGRPQGRVDIETLATTIAHSQIVAAPLGRGRLPANFEAVDGDILDWIADECRLASRRLLDE